NPNSQSQNLMIMITVVLVFKIIWLYSGLTERVSTSEQTQLKFSPCFFPDYKLPFAAETEIQSIPEGANRFNLHLGRAKRV
ncbi:hypothetical protein, partial [Acinetobacter baumannii]|uniref:hypothetical protein n=2 Tax=Acinetobacter calcoaceticus/baumannii complex TaxID=909768 RepID=UPI001C03CA4D